MITKYGYDVFFTVITICVLLGIASFYFVKPDILRYLLIALSVAFIGFTINFFRDPERVTPAGEKLVIAPADGKIIKIQEDVDEPEFIKGKATVICIFMSPLNVHVNRNPVSGRVGYIRYLEGEYFAAFEDKASEKNEQSIIGINSPFGKVLFKQIAGFVARRIVYTHKVGDTAVAGERFGMIKFGSRVDVYLPAGSRIRVSNGEKTAAGETILAEFQ